jgi:hypothetical protein
MYETVVESTLFLFITTLYLPLFGLLYCLYECKCKITKISCEVYSDFFTRKITSCVAYFVSQN